MKTKQQQQQIIQNFLITMDMEMSMVDHFDNCMRDAELYMWPSPIVVGIMSGIEDAYKKKGSK